MYKIVKMLELYTHNIVLMENKVRNGNRYCQKCGHKLQKYGLYKNGIQK